MSSSCLPTPTGSTAYTLSAASQLPTTDAHSSASRNTFVSRNGSRLEVNGDEFKAVGANVYWLGLDENVDPSPSYPSKGRVLEAMAVASVMGATTIRSQSLGISVGTGLSVENALNTFKDKSFGAWDAIDFAVYAARSYDLRLVIPLTDQYDYYHAASPPSSAGANFTSYVRTLLTHVSPYTNLTLASDPTVFAFETGNELGGWTGSHYPSPVEWATAISQLLKELAPQTLVLSGSYGVRKDELGITTVDMHSDHFYPTYTSRLSRSASLAHSASKPFLAGEYDWTNRLYSQLRWAWFAMALPVVVAALLWATPGRWWERRRTVRGCCGCGGRKRRRRRARAQERGGEDAEMELDAAVSDVSPPYDRTLTSSASSTADKPLYASVGSSASLPILSSSPSTSFPPSRHPSASASSSWLDRPFLLQRWHVALALLIVLLPTLGALLHVYLPNSISAFLGELESLSSSSSSSSSSPKAAGDLYWSLFGRTDECCAYVQHNDGYTLHYPSSPSARSGAGRGSGEAVLRLTKHAWRVRGERPYWLEEGKELEQVKMEDLPVVACPQEGLRWANGTVVGG
ncbi:hypothetical protein JCM8097_004507 [Rhodosporidiobolus ruineniae]